MDDTDPPLDAMLRRNALQQALYLYVGSAFGHAKPETVLATATQFYEFLKGETK